MAKAKYYVMDSSGRTKANTMTLAAAKKKASALAKKKKQTVYVGNYEKGKIIHNVGSRY